LSHIVFKNAKGDAEKEVRKFKKKGLELKFLYATNQTASFFLMIKKIINNY